MQSPLNLDVGALEAAARRHALAVCTRLEARYRGNPGFVFDAAAAQKAVDFFPTFLKHSIGPLAGQPFVLEGWQEAIVRMVWGWRHRASGLRVIRTVYLFVARKNGKSTFCAGLALLLLLSGGEAGPEVLSAAADREQAGIVFREAARMVGASPDLEKLCLRLKGAIVCEQLQASYRVLSADAETKHGLNPSGILFDELHTQPKRDLYDVLHTAVGARRQALEVLITTAGTDRNSICWEIHAYAAQVHDGQIDDPTFLPVLFAAADDDDWRDPQVWVKANPSLGAAIQLDYLAREAERAARVPAYQNTFRRLHLNQWTEQETRWLDPADWDDCAGPVQWDAMEAAMRGRRCFVGLDLSTTTDLTALALVWQPPSPDEPWCVAWRFYMPEMTLRRRAERDRVPFPAWRDQHAIIATPGNEVDYARIESDLVRLTEQQDVGDIGYDPWNAYQLAQRLTERGLRLVQVRQGLPSLTAPSKELERLVLSRKLAHGGHPVAAWMARNVAVKMDDNANIKPDKAASADRIDGIVAMIVALARAMAANAGAVSIWDRDDGWAPKGDAASGEDAPVPAGVSLWDRDEAWDEADPEAGQSVWDREDA